MKKVLILFRNGCDIDLLLKSYKNLNHSFGFEMVPLFVNDISYSMPVRDTVMGSGIAVKLLDEINTEFLEKVKTGFQKYGFKENIIIETGLTTHALKEHLKYCDLLLLNQESLLDDVFIDTLKIIFRPLIIIRNKPLTFEKIAIASNDGIKVNISTYNFLNLFDDSSIENVSIFTWNYGEPNLYLNDLIKGKGFKTKVYNFNTNDHSIDDFYYNLNQFDLMIMGNLSRSFFFEKITNRMGLNLLENITTNIFIG